MKNIYSLVVVFSLIFSVELYSRPGHWPTSMFSSPFHRGNPSRFPPSFPGHNCRPAAGAGFWMFRSNKTPVSTAVQRCLRIRGTPMSFAGLRFVSTRHCSPSRPIPLLPGILTPRYGWRSPRECWLLRAHTA